MTKTFNEISDIREVLNLVLIVVMSILYIALTISMLGLTTTMVMNVNQRKSEIGMLRSLGISKWQVIQMVFGETLIICATSLIIGIICGFVTGLLVSNVPFMAYAPVFFTVQWNEIFILSMFISILSVVTSVIPAIKAIRLNIIDSIRKRGM